MTHQDIIDRVEALGREHGDAYRIEQARIKKERQSLQELCGGLGHFFAKSESPFMFELRRCVFCKMSEPKVGA